MQITLDRLYHSIAVARKMRTLAINNQEEYPVDPEEAFVLGMYIDALKIRKIIRSPDAYRHRLLFKKIK